MVTRNDPFVELDRLSQHMLGTAVHPGLVPTDASYDGDSLAGDLDLPGMDLRPIDLDVERNLLTIWPNAVRAPATSPRP